MHIGGSGLSEPRLDELLYQFIVQVANAYTPEKKYPIWRLVSAGEKLPFEQMIFTYSLVEGGFKQIRP